MAEGQRWQVVDYEQADGQFPIREYLASLDARNARQAAPLLAKLAERGNQMRPPDSVAVEGRRNLFELRGHQVRIFYMFLPGRMIVLLDGIVKKQDKIARRDLDRVLAYQRDVEHRGPRAP